MAISFPVFKTQKLSQISIPRANARFRIRMVSYSDVNDTRLQRVVHSRCFSSKFLSRDKLAVSAAKSTILVHRQDCKKDLTGPIRCVEASKLLKSNTKIVSIGLICKPLTWVNYTKIFWNMFIWLISGRLDSKSLNDHQDESFQ
jgi:hypothetical protein